jgi:predicted nucleotidyltransferase
LGRIYSQLYIRFETTPFSFEQAIDALSIDSNRLNVAFSRLHSERIVTIFKRSRPRIYRLLAPASFVLLASGVLKNVARVRQEHYLPLILESFRRTRSMLCIQSFAIYGSVARGRAKESSDVDVLVVSNDFEGSMGKRIEQLLAVEAAVQEEIASLRKQGILTALSFFPLRRSEAEAIPKLFLDLTEDAILLYDEGEFLQRLLLGLKAKLLTQGAVRVFLDEDRWYWDLKPDYRFGEVVEIH